MSSPPHLPTLSLTPEQRSYLLQLGVMSAAASSGDSEILRREWLLLLNDATKLGVSLQSLERSFLDAIYVAHVFIGVPRCIEALTTLHAARAHTFDSTTPGAADTLWREQIKQDPQFGYAVVNPPPPCITCRDPSSTASRMARGQATFSAIYTHAAPKLHTALQQLHPDLHHSIIGHVYGHALSSPRLRLFEVETIAVSVLSGLHTPRQLASHLRGSLLIGLPAGFITDLLESAFDVWQDEGVYGVTMEVWRTVMRSHRRNVAQARGTAVNEEAERKEEEAAEDRRMQRAEETRRRQAEQSQTETLLPPGQRPEAGMIEAELSMDDDQQATQSQPSQLSDDDVASTVRSLFRRRYAARDRELALHQSQSTHTGTGTSDTSASGAAYTGEPDRWPVPLHVLDPTGGAGIGAVPGAGMGMGMGMGMGTAPGAFNVQHGQAGGANHGGLLARL